MVVDPLALVIPYTLAWISHFFIEDNKPASFEHPLWSWWADQRMVALMLVGKMEEEVGSTWQAKRNLFDKPTRLRNVEEEPRQNKKIKCKLQRNRKD